MAEGHRKRYEKHKFSSTSTNNPKSHPAGFTLKGKKRLAEESAPDSPDAKAQRLEDGFIYVINKAGEIAPYTDEAPFAPTNWWNDVGFETLLFKSSRLPFSKEFPANYPIVCSKLISTIVNMNDTLLMRELML